MFGMDFLEVIIGLLFVYLLLSLLAGIINEIICGVISLRGRFLAKAITRFIDDDNNHLSELFFEHPLFKKIRPPSQFKWLEKLKYPSYLAKDGFSRILLNSLLSVNSGNNLHSGPVTFEKVKKNVQQHLKEGETKQMLLSFIHEAEQAENKLAKFKEILENWYEAMMDRAAGWYKRRIQLFLFIIGLVIATLFNADTFQIAHNLSVNPEQRQQLVELAETFSEKVDKDGLRKYYEMSIQQKMDSSFVADLKTFSQADSLQALELYYNALRLREILQNDIPSVTSVLGLGSITDIKIPETKKGFWSITGWVIRKLSGWILTALAISLGATFWFDMLKKVMNIRAAGNIPEDIRRQESFSKR